MYNTDDWSDIISKFNFYETTRRENNDASLEENDLYRCIYRSVYFFVHPYKLFDKT